MPILGVLALLAVVFAAAQEPSLFPKPTSYTKGAAVTLGNFIASQTVHADSKDDISSAKDYLSNLAQYIFYPSVIAHGTVNAIDTTIYKTATIPMESDSGYSISVSGSTIKVLADDIFGAFNAYQTIAELIKYDEELGSYVIYAYTIQDTPRFKWRGLHIDTARHFYPLSAIRRQIIAMAAAKFNVLHWHLVDAESFPWKPDNYPEMANGAYRDGKLFYTSQDIKTIFDFGKMWGIYVYIEIDTPGHTYSWRKGHEEIVADCPSKSYNINNVALDISNDLTYSIASDLYNEILAITGKYIHLGGDEVITSCWNEDPDTAAMMQNKGLDGHGIWKEYETRIDGLINPEAVPIYWQEAFQYGTLSNVRTTAIIHSWEDQKTLGDIVKAGYRGLLSGGWYLDQQIPALDDTTHYAFYETWKDFYANEPTAGLNLTADQEKLILGGEVCMWSEGVDVGSIDTMIWPRALAVAERLWSSKDTTDEDDAKARIQVHRCQLLRRGIAVGPIGPNEPCDGQFEYWDYVQYNN